MSSDQSANLTMMVRVPPGSGPNEKRGIGRKIWVGTSRVIGFVGGAVLPFAQAWYMAGAPGGQASVVMANFLQRFSSSVVQNVNTQMYSSRAQANPYEAAQVLQNVYSGTTTNLSQPIDSVLQNRSAAINEVLIGPESLKDE